MIEPRHMTDSELIQEGMRHDANLLAFFLALLAERLEMDLESIRAENLDYLEKIEKLEYRNENLEHQILMYEADNE